MAEHTDMDTTNELCENVAEEEIIHGAHHETLREEEDDANLVKGFESLNPNKTEAEEEMAAASSSSFLEKSLSSSKLNAEAPEFIPGKVQAQPQVGPVFQNIVDSTPFFEQQEGVVCEAESAAPSPAKIALTDELKQRIVKQVEFYFSDANLPTDKYLTKFVKKDPEGFVPIPVVASFRKMKSLIHNNNAWVVAALKASSQLVLSEDGKKVRRLHPLPDIDIEEVQSRTVVAENLPNDYSVQNLEKLFSGVGNVKMVRVCHPQGYNDSGQASTRHSKNDMLVSNRLHALVEYETVEQAEKAVVELNDEGNWRSGLRVQLLLKRMVKYGHKTKGRKTEKADVHVEEEEADAVNDKTSKVSAHLQSEHDDLEADGHQSNERNGGRRGRGRGRGKSHGRGQYHGNGRSHPVGTSTSSNSTSSEVVAKQPPGPRMPDGTRGFTLGRGRPLCDSNA